MPTWTAETPGTFEFDEVRALRVRLIGGSVAVLASDERPSVSITRISGRPLVISEANGVLTSVSGDLTLAGGLLRGLRTDSVSGDLTADVEPTPDSSMRAGNVSGKVTLRLPEDLSAQVRLNSMSGKITSDFTSLASVRSPASRSVSGKVGAGSGQVSVTSVSGAVTLLRRAKVESEIR
jgi:DUF4097 and DUF4098 domain-containing protein YvlB